MKNHETELKLQAYLDNELSADEVRMVEELLLQDEQARALFGELRSTKELLVDGEVERTLPESREFYWSKIQREIAKSEVQSEAEIAPQPRNWWLRFFVPMAGTAALALMFATVLRDGTFGISPNMAGKSYFHEIEPGVDEASTISFRSEEAGMTVVWIESQRN